MVDLEAGWRDIPEGGVITEAGNSEEYLTGAWRAHRPVLDLEKCIHCFICWINCPDLSICVEGDKMVGFDLDHCKGCGICAQVCPKDAITMKNEFEFASEEEV